MVQFIQLPESTKGRLGRELGTAISQGVSRNFEQPEQRVQRGILQQAFDQINPEASYEENLKAIAPTLLTTQGGADALNALAPIMQQRSKNKAVSNALRNRTGDGGEGEKPGEIVPSGVEEPGQPPGQNVSPGIGGDVSSGPSATDRFRNPSLQGAREPLYPGRSTGPQTQPLFTPEEFQASVLDLMEKSSDMGTPIDYAEGSKIIGDQQGLISANNQQLLQEQQLQNAEIKDLSKDIVKRAVNTGLIEGADDEFLTVVEKLGYEGRNEESPAKRWEYVKSGMDSLKSARKELRTMGTIPGPMDTIWRKLNGTYKSKQEMTKDIHNTVKPYLRHGLYDEAREAISTNLGLGPEDTEMAIFPFSSEEQKNLDSFTSNKPGRFREPQVVSSLVGGEMTIPSTQQDIEDPTKFNLFKDELANYIDRYPESNLVTLRGYLSESKNYSWRDFERAISELRDEERFEPDNFQRSQLPVIRHAPVPGLGEQFRFLMKGTK